MNLNLNIEKLLKDKSRAANTGLTPDGVSYVDLWLDFRNEFYRKRNQDYKDLKVAYDEYAIRNSLINLFNTNKGERLLLPEYGVNIKSYLFEPITEINANLIGQDLLRAVERWEPRVSVEKISVEGKVMLNQYNITLALLIPLLKIQVALSGIFTQDAFNATTLRRIEI